MKALIQALNNIAATTELDCDVESYEYIVYALEQNDNEGAQFAYKIMDTCARDFLADAARVCPLVKQQAAEVLNLEWLF